MTTTRTERIVYGPVPSWRLGRSLGIDLVSRTPKTCSFDCAYCQLGPTRRKTAWREEFVPVSRLVEELDALPPLELDYVTFSGTAEPTLAGNLGDAIEAVKTRIAAPVAVLTNSSLMPDPQVRRDLARADVVVAKLDAPTEALLRKVNRPSRGITLARIVAALHTFRREYRGQLALQIMFYRANQDRADALAVLARQIQPDEVQINTPLRPCPVQPLSPRTLRAIMPAFAGVNAISVYDAAKPSVQPLDMKETLRRRPVL